MTPEESTNPVRTKNQAPNFVSEPDFARFFLLANPKLFSSLELVDDLL